MAKWDPKPFRSFDAWFSHEGFIRIVKEEWRSLGEMSTIDKFNAL